MQVSVENTSGIARKMQVNVPKETFDAALQKRYKDLTKTAKIPGFRPGKAPLDRLKQLYGDSLKQEVAAKLMQSHYVKAIESEGLSVCGYPSFELGDLKEDSDFTFTASFEVYPEVALTPPESAVILQPVATVAEADIDDMVEKVRAQHKTWESVDRPAALGDQVIIDFVGRKDGEAFEGGTSKDFTLELGAKQFIEGFEDGLVGAKAGDTKALPLQFPESYHSKDLAGQDVVFDVTVHAVKASVLPPADDTLAAQFQLESGGLPALREHLQKHMERELTQRIQSQIKAQAMDALALTHDFDLPKALVERECETMQQSMHQRMVQQFGQQMAGKDLPTLALEHFEPEAKRRVKLGLLLAAFVEGQQVEPTEAQMTSALEELVAPYQDPEQMISWYRGNKEKMAEVKAMVLEQLLVDWVLSKAQVKEQAMPYNEAIAWEKPKVEASKEEAASS